MKQFLEAIEKNLELKAKVEALCKNPDVQIADVIALAKEYGFEITEADFKVTEADKELLDDELTGISNDCCGCPFVGGGTGGGVDSDGNNELDCVCVIGGGGAYINNKGKTQTRCVCVVAGAGAHATLCYGRNGNPWI